MTSKMLMAVAAAAAAALPGPSWAAKRKSPVQCNAGSCTVALQTTRAAFSFPGGDRIPMWAYLPDTGSCIAATTPLSRLPEWAPGPTLRLPAGATQLVVALRNCLPEPSSLLIVGQPAPLGSAPVRRPPTTKSYPSNSAPGGAVTMTYLRAQSFVSEAAPGGGLQTYTFKAPAGGTLKPGTWLYESGSHQAVQVQMGLYGAMTLDWSSFGVGVAYGPVPGGTQTGVAYDADKVLVFSEIDPAVHAAVDSGNFGSPAPASAGPGYLSSAIEYHPKVFLVNGLPYRPRAADMSGLVPDVQPNDKLLLRFVNAGLNQHVAQALNANLSVVAEDGNPYAFAKRQYSAVLPAGKTMDAIFSVPAAGVYRIFDRALGVDLPGGNGAAANNLVAATSTGGLVADVVVGGAATRVNVPDRNYLFTPSVGRTSFVVPALDGLLEIDRTPIPPPPAPPVQILLAESVPKAASIATAQKGTVAIAPDGSFIYTPLAGFAGKDFFTYLARASLTGAASNVGVVSIDVGAAKLPPLAGNYGYADAAGKATIVAASMGLLSNNKTFGAPTSVLNGNPAVALIVEQPKAPCDGDIVQMNADGSFVYQGSGNLLSRVCTFTFAIQSSNGLQSSPPICDGLNPSGCVTMALTTPATANPIAVDDFASPANTTVVSTPAGPVTAPAPIGDWVGMNNVVKVAVLTNDVIFQALPATVQIVSQPSGKGANYCPPGIGNCAPLPYGYSAQKTCGTPTGPACTMNSDCSVPPAAAVACTAFGLNSSVSVNADGTIQFRPGYQFRGTDSFTYRITTPGVSNTATVQVNIR